MHGEAVTWPPPGHCFQGHKLGFGRVSVSEEIRGKGDAPRIQTASAARQYHLSTSSVAGLLKQSWNPPILCHSLEMMLFSQEEQGRERRQTCIKSAVSVNDPDLTFLLQN